MNNLNKNELMVGFLIQLVFFYWMGWWVLPAACISSFLWALSGEHGQEKLWRRLGVPLVTAIALYIHTHIQWVFIVVPIDFGVLSIGYGIPSIQPLDEGSVLGRFWFNISPKWVNFLTRGTIYTLYILPFILLLIVFR